MKTYILTLFFSVFLVCSVSFTHAVSAEDGLANVSSKDDEAEIYNSQLMELIYAGECEKVWDGLWPKAKNGDLKARAILFSLVSQLWPAEPRILMPGRSRDFLSQQRDGLILGIHSLGLNKKWDEKIISELKDAISRVLEKHYWEKLEECLELKDGDFCADYAVTGAKHQKVQSFESYVAEIDALLAAGMKPTCLYFSKNAREEWLQEEEAWKRDREESWRSHHGENWREAYEEYLQEKTGVKKSDQQKAPVE